MYPTNPTLAIIVVELGITHGNVQVVITFRVVEENPVVEVAVVINVIMPVVDTANLMVDITKEDPRNR